MPESSLPGALISRGLEAPQARITRSYSCRSSSAFLSFPISTPVTNSTPSSSMSFCRLASTALSSFMLGMPYIRRPPTRSRRSNTVTLWPRRFSWRAAARPEGPLPTTATLYPVRTAGSPWLTRPWAKAYSTIVRSFSFVETGWLWTLQVQAASQRAGQTREVNSGKQWVFLSLCQAASRLPRYTRSLNSGTRLWSGQPEAIPLSILPNWQKGTPQSMQRAPWSLCSSKGRLSWNSQKSLILSLGALTAPVFLSYSKKPVAFPIFTVLPSVSARYSHKRPLPGPVPDPCPAPRISGSDGGSSGNHRE